MKQKIKTIRKFAKIHDIMASCSKVCVLFILVFDDSCPSFYWRMFSLQIELAKYYLKNTNWHLFQLRSSVSWKNKAKNTDN
jgi:hypothetical protein